MYPGVPFRPVVSPEGGSIAASPMSEITALPSSPKRTLSGFKSRCTMRSEWRWEMPSAMWAAWTRHRSSEYP